MLQPQHSQPQHVLLSPIIDHHNNNRNSSSSNRNSSSDNNSSNMFLTSSISSSSASSLSSSSLSSSPSSSSVITIEQRPTVTDSFSWSDFQVTSNPSPFMIKPLPSIPTTSATSTPSPTDLPSSTPKTTTVPTTVVIDMADGDNTQTTVETATAVSSSDDDDELQVMEMEDEDQDQDASSSDDEDDENDSTCSIGSTSSSSLSSFLYMDDVSMGDDSDIVALSRSPKSTRAKQQQPINNKKKKSVRFANTIEIRNYNVVLSDHPLCEDGLAIELDWWNSDQQQNDPDATEQLDLDTHEEYKSILESAFHQQRQALYGNRSSFSLSSSRRPSWSGRFTGLMGSTVQRRTTLEKQQLLHEVGGYTMMELHQAMVNAIAKRQASIVGRPLSRQPRSQQQQQLLEEDQSSTTTSNSSTNDLASMATIMLDGADV